MNKIFLFFVKNRNRIIGRNCCNVIVVMFHLHSLIYIISMNIIALFVVRSRNGGIYEGVVSICSIFPRVVH